MKKVLSVFLAILMMLSVCTVAFAADETEDTSVTEATEEETTDPASDFDFNELPDWAKKVIIKVGPKLAKPIIKIVMFFVRFAFKLGLIDSDKVIGDISNAFTTTVPTEASTEVALA